MFTSSVQLRHCSESYFFQVYCCLNFLYSPFHPFSSSHLLGMKGTWGRKVFLFFFFFFLFYSLIHRLHYLTWWWICEFLEQQKWKKWIKKMNKTFHPLKTFSSCEIPLLVCGLFPLLPFLPFFPDYGQFGSYQSPGDILQSLSPFWVDFILFYFVSVFLSNFLTLMHICLG